MQAEFQVLESNKFTEQFEEAAFWLYSHNLEQSEEFADRKFLELEQEVNHLKLLLKKTPAMGAADEQQGLRRFPLYSGRYLATWVCNDQSKAVILLEFIDSKYPKELRQFSFDE